MNEGALGWAVFIFLLWVQSLGAYLRQPHPISFFCTMVIAGCVGVEVWLVFL